VHCGLAVSRISAAGRSVGLHDDHNAGLSARFVSRNVLSHGFRSVAEPPLSHCGLIAMCSLGLTKQALLLPCIRAHDDACRVHAARGSCPAPAAVMPRLHPQTVAVCLGGQRAHVCFPTRRYPKSRGSKTGCICLSPSSLFKTRHRDLSRRPQPTSNEKRTPPSFCLTETFGRVLSLRR
jgi:hypothetical protein